MNIPYKDIDPCMRPIIRELNKKGWITCGCCEGHWNEEKQMWSPVWLTFKGIGLVGSAPKSQRIRDVLISPILNYNPPTLSRIKPINGKITRDNHLEVEIYGCDGQINFKWVFGDYKRDKETKDEEWRIMLALIYDWAKQLPTFNGEYLSINTDRYKVETKIWNNR